ncbi:MAG: L-threonylcarbamoyladenylate synthase [Firmicutes bacterium]|nr:L-threonylcarbamoyladenylate synthase [Bacillota bacterium]
MKTLRLTDPIAAAEILKRGGLVAVPTETVYGLAANALDEEAVLRIYEVKGRPEVKALSVMVSDMHAIDAYCFDVPRAAYSLATAFWPGPLTLIFKAKPGIPNIVRAGGGTLGLRCPKHPLTLKLLEAAQLPLAAPSANPSGLPAPMTADQVLSYFDGQIDAVLDGGPCEIGEASTILDLSVAPYKVLRQGALAEAEIRRTLAEALTVIGLTGGTGTGKTTALAVLKGMGALAIDADAIYHSLLETDAALQAELRKNFPGAFINGSLDRKALGGMVFSDPGALLKLNAVTHKYVEIEIRRLLEDWAVSGGTAAAIDAVALIESGLDKRCDAVIGVLAPEAERVRRVAAREGISESYAKLRAHAQQSDDFYREHCGYILENNGDLEAFVKKCETLFRKILHP